MSDLRRLRFKEALGNGPLLKLFDYWERKADGRRMPEPKAIDPVDIPELLPNLYILDIPREREASFRFRLAGTGVRELFNQEVTGKRLDEVLPERDLWNNAQRSYGTIIREKAPWLTDILYELDWGDTFRYRRLAMPLGKEGEDVTRILGAFELEGAPGKRLPFHQLLHRIGRTLERYERAG